MTAAVATNFGRTGYGRMGEFITGHALPDYRSFIGASGVVVAVKDAYPVEEMTFIPLINGYFKFIYIFALARNVRVFS